MSIGRKKIEDGFKTPQARYDANHSLQMSLKLNNESDADIIAALEGKARQTEVKRLIRIGLAAERDK